MSDDGALARRLGIFARTFRRDTPEDVAAEVARAGYPLAHWNFAAIGLPTLASDVGRETFARVRAAFAAQDVAIPSVSVTFNVAHPDRERRRRETAAAVDLIARVPDLGADLATLCSGTRDPRDIWRSHSRNADADAWSDMRETLDLLLTAADRASVRLGIEPEAGNIVRDAETAARLLAELGPEAPIGIVLDPANLLSPATVSDQDEILRRAVDLLGDRIVSVHAKDVGATGSGAAGTGGLDYRLVFELLASRAPVPLIVQDADEADASRVRQGLLRWSEEQAASQGLPAPADGGGASRFQMR
jgi:sugar phosphate isomerase/epimerase